MRTRPLGPLPVPPRTCGSCPRPRSPPPAGHGTGIPPACGHQALTSVLVAWKIVLQISVQDIGQLTDFSHRRSEPQASHPGSSARLPVSISCTGPRAHPQPRMAGTASSYGLGDHAHPNRALNATASHTPGPAIGALTPAAHQPGTSPHSGSASPLPTQMTQRLITEATSAPMAAARVPSNTHLGLKWIGDQKFRPVRVGQPIVASARRAVVLIARR